MLSMVRSLSEKEAKPMPRTKKPKGRPVTLKMPEQIPDTPENVAKALMKTPRPKQWKYLKKKQEVKS